MDSLEQFNINQHSSVSSCDTADAKLCGLLFFPFGNICEVERGPCCVGNTSFSGSPLPSNIGLDWCVVRHRFPYILNSTAFLLAVPMPTQK